MRHKLWTDDRTNSERAENVTPTKRHTRRPGTIIRSKVKAEKLSRGSDLFQIVGVNESTNDYSEYRIIVSC